MCEKEKDLCENNGRYNIYLNTNGTNGDINLDLELLFEYINGGTSAIGKKTNNELVNLIDDYVVEFNSSNTWRKGYMTLELLMQDNYKAGLAKGEAKAEAKYRAKAKKKEAQSVKAMYSDHVSIDKIAKYVSLSEDEVRAILSEK